MPEADTRPARHAAGWAGRGSSRTAFGARGGIVWRLVAAGNGRIGRLSGRGVRAACALGRGGVSDRKREGDGATPAGCWPVRRLLFRPGRLGPPRSHLAVRAVGLRDGWCDDSGHPAYNRPVRLPLQASAERLQRADRLYDLVVELGYNDDPPMAGAGSAIFLHVARPGLRPTAGCIAVPRQVLRRIIAVMQRGDRIRVQSGRPSTGRT